MFLVFHAFLSVHCSLVVTCWERVNFLALLYVMFSCVLSVLGQVWNLIVSMTDLCLLIYLKSSLALFVLSCRHGINEWTSIIHWSLT